MHEDRENNEGKQEALSVEAATEKFDAVLENDEMKDKLDQLANKRGMSLEVVKNSIQVFVEDYPNNPKLGMLLEKLSGPQEGGVEETDEGGEDSDEEQSQEDAMEELLDLIA